MFNNSQISTQSTSLKTQTHKMFKRTLFIRTKGNVRIFGIIPFIKLQIVL